MNIITKKQMEELMEEYPDGGIVFAEYRPSILASQLMVTDGDFGAVGALSLKPKTTGNNKKEIIEFIKGFISEWLTVYLKEIN